MKDERAAARNTEDARVEDELAPGDHQIRLKSLQKALHVARVGALDDQCGHVVEASRIQRAEPGDLLRDPGPVGPGLAQTVVGAERQDVQEPDHAHPANLPPDPPDEDPGRVAQHDEAHQLQRTREPGGQSLAIEGVPRMADEDDRGPRLVARHVYATLTRVPAARQ